MDKGNGETEENGTIQASLTSVVPTEADPS